MQIKITFSPFKFPSGKWREEERRGGEGEGERKGRGIKKKKCNKSTKNPKFLDEYEEHCHMNYIQKWSNFYEKVSSVDYFTNNANN